MAAKKKANINKSQVTIMILLTVVFISLFTSIKLFKDNLVLKQNNAFLSVQKIDSVPNQHQESLIDQQTISVDNGFVSITGSAGEPIKINTESLKENGVLRLLNIDTGGTQDFEKIDPKNVFTSECGYIHQKPTEVTLTCGDGGILVRDIKWEVWKASGASGTGIHSVNQCEPDCANGERIEVPVQVKLSRLMTDGERFYLTSFNAYTLDGQILEMGWTFPWEFEDILLTEDGSIASPFLNNIS